MKRRVVTIVQNLDSSRAIGHLGDIVDNFPSDNFELINDDFIRKETYDVNDPAEIIITKDDGVEQLFILNSQTAIIGNVAVWYKAGKE